MKQDRNYSSISPSARSLLLMKGYTNIPFAQQTAALMQGPEAFDLSFDEKDFGFWIRVMHFESRYWSIDQLLKQVPNTNIMELSSGYALRGLHMCMREAVHYIDTDLPEVIATKKQLIEQLRLGGQLKGRFEMAPLNAMDAAAFNEVAGHFADGPVTVVNEGLLMYLNREEKSHLCRTIHNLLQARGGCWITADVYIKRTEEMQRAIIQSKREAAFFQEHKIEENKFDNFEEARVFFEEQGFKVIKEAEPNLKELSVMPRLLETMPQELKENRKPPPKLQATWMLGVQ
jgi:O-Methyltransferase involved in polyketide biosynthesis